MTDPVPLKALIVDDEAPARSELRYLLGEAGGVQIVGEATGAAEALQLISAIEYDVVFLDIEMPGLSGLELAAALRAAARSPAVVFVTAYGEHAVKAFEVAAVDYLVKPVELPRLRLALDRIVAGLPPGGAAGGPDAQEPATRPTAELPEHADGAGSTAPAAGVPAPRAPGPQTGGSSPAAGEHRVAHLDRIPVDRSGRKLLLAGEDILFISAYDDYTYVHTADGRYLSTLSMNALQQRLAGLGFFRTHRSYLVNLRRVKEVVPMYGGTLLLTLADRDGTQIPVSRRRVAGFKRALGM